MLQIDPRRTAVVAIDMHRGHLDPAVATMPLAPERCGPVIDRAARLFHALRDRGIPIVHVVTEYRDPEESLSNPFWKAIQEDPTKARRTAARHNLQGSPGTQIIPELYDARDLVVRDKKRYNPFHATNLDFVLQHRLRVETLILAGINTSSCVLCCAFEATNRDYRVIIASDAVDSMDGEEMHSFALRLMAATVGWPLANSEILEAVVG